MADDLPLRDWTIAVPESRQLDVLTDMLEVRGAEVVRCPLVAIRDSPDDDTIRVWLETFCTTEFDDFVILTGEGIRRLTGFAERFGMLEQWITALTRVRKIARGPKPGSALRPFSLKPEVLACEPTTEGVIQTLSAENLQGRKIAVQLYGEEANERLQSFLRAQGAQISVVSPYIYASDVETIEVTRLIDALLAQSLDILIFTSVVQIKRLLAVAKKEQREDALLAALRTTTIAAIGPIVEAMLKTLDLPITVVPDDKFFMKPLVRKLVQYAKSGVR